MTYRQLIAKILECGMDLDSEATVRVVRRNSGSSAISRREVPVRYFSLFSNICIEQQELDKVQVLEY